MKADRIIKNAIIFTADILARSATVSSWRKRNLMGETLTYEDLDAVCPDADLQIQEAEFLVFDNDLLTAEHEGFSYNCPSEVFFGGKKM